MRIMPILNNKEKKGRNSEQCFKAPKKAEVLIKSQGKQYSKNL